MHAFVSFNGCFDFKIFFFVKQCFELRIPILTGTCVSLLVWMLRWPSMNIIMRYSVLLNLSPPPPLFSQLLSLSDFFKFKRVLLVFFKF